ncbi:MAG: export ABC transporter ATP-binding protein [Planctomycetes bacterium]|nr:export ABC transporter ATP-binding protein [Planctomycetota bacterium]
MIEVQNLRKQYGDLVAVEDVSFTAEAGQIFGLLGPNGAGKSTTISCLCGLLPPTSGQVRILGHDVVQDGPASRQQLGVVPQELALYEDLNAADNLAYWGAAYGLSGAALRSRVSTVLEAIGLLDRAKEPVSQFSGGMKRRLNLGCAIVHEPKVLLLDEPTVGVDPQSRVRLLELVRELVDAGTCVLYTTHYMEEAEALCDRLAILDHGRIIAAGTLNELRGRVSDRDLVRLSGQFPVEAVRGALEALAEAEVLQIEEDQLRLAIQAAGSRLPELFQVVQQAGGEIRETNVARPSLESLFIELTGKELRE